MTGPGGFSISPAVAARPEPVTLSLPATGYRAQAFVTDPCGAPIRGAYVTTSGRTATPHLPVSYHGTVYVDFQVQAVRPAATGGRVSLVLASKQTDGRASTCTSHPSPYGGHQHPAPHHPAAAVQAVTTAAHPSTLDLVTGIGGFALLAAALVAGCWLWWRRRHPRGAHHA